jgi:hypothetical protein
VVIRDVRKNKKALLKFTRPSYVFSKEQMASGSYFVYFRWACNGNEKGAILPVGDSFSLTDCACTP